MERQGRRIARGGGTIFYTSLLAKASSVIASVVIARVLGPFQLGEWTLVTSVTGIIYMLIELGTGTASVRMISAIRERDPARAELVAHNYLVFELATSIPILVVFAAVSPLLAGPFYQDQALLPLFLLSAATIFMWTLAACYGAVLQAYERIRLLAKLSLGFGLANSALLLVFVVVWGLIGGFTASLLANTVQLLMYRFVLRQSRLFGKAGLRVDRHIVRELLFYALPTFVGSTFYVVFNWVGATLVSSTVGLANLGNYTVALRLAFVVMYVPTAIVVPFFPMASGVYERDPSEFAQTLHHTLRYVLMIVFPLTLIISLFSRPLVSLVYTSAYSGAAEILPITASAAFFASFASSANLVYYVTKAMRRQVALSCLVFCVSMVALVTLTSRYGITGFAWATLAFYGVGVAFAPLLLGRRFADLRFRKMVVAALLLGAAVLAAGVASSRLEPVVSALVGICVVPLVCTVIYMRFMNDRDRSFIGKVVRGALRLERDNR